MLVHDAAYRLSRMLRDVKIGYSIGEAQDRAAQRHEPVYNAVSAYLVEAGQKVTGAIEVVEEALRSARSHGSY